MHTEQTIETVIRMFVSAPLYEPLAPNEHPALAAALDHVRSEWQRRLRPIELTELAAAACISKEHFGRLFAKHYGTGAVHALELVRLTHGEALLTRTTMSIADIARDCGYTDPLHFSKRFRAAFGASPLAYRRGNARSSPLAAAGLLPLSRRLSPG
jgi:transcriptional regulator GlxA family with amidase domain